MYELGDRLYWFDSILIGEAVDLPSDAPERYATVDEIDSDGVIYVVFDDGVEDWYPPTNLQDYFERVTWEGTNRP